jgi:hypothetical protein
MMSRPLLWITTLVLGAAATLLTSFGGLFGSLAFLLLAAPLVVRGDRIVAMSGLLLGFGGSWSLLLQRQFAYGGALDGASFWIAVGLVPLAVGCVLAVATVVRMLSRRRADGPS